MKLKRPKLKLKPQHVIHKVRKTVTSHQPGESEPVRDLPRITNETVAEHREAVLSRARKYVYPLPHSKHRIVKLSMAIVVVAVLVFFAWCGLALYRFQSTSAFTYDVTRVFPFPVAKVGSRFIAYENYLFELRRNMHYYETQQKVDFGSTDGKRRLVIYKKQAMQDVINNTYVKQLAAEHHVSVSDQEVNNEVALVQSENRLGGNQQVFEDVLSEFWGWTMSDFKRELKQQLLAEKVVSTLDTATHQRAQQALNALQHGAKFADIAKQSSDDVVTRNQGGQYAGTIAKSDRDISPQVAAELFKLKPGQTSGIINSGTSLEIVKVISRQGDKVKAAHIEFEFKDVNTYINGVAAKEAAHKYIHV
ncbi:MAG TPA: SurA N-terminal domain-containing protein [Candidatus Saccharimonadales bacterium]|nr:SurA N-terminal domain-containing protein [Candidatus Saccharimonadales bacterium]